MKIALVTMLDDNFVVGYEVFIKSFLHYNKWFTYPFIIIDLDLSKKNKAKIQSYYKNIIFRKPNKHAYRNVNFSKTHPILQSTYYKLDIFSYTDYDRLVFIDMDVVVLGDLTELFNFQGKIAACKGYNRRKDRLTNNINSGVFVINKPFINDKEYKYVLKFAEQGHKMPDQTTINVCYKEEMEYFNKAYNCEKRILHSERYDKYKDPRNIKILHYVGWKPWQDNTLAPQHERIYHDYEKLWHKWAKR